jgi:hypothetical protein
MALVSRPSPFTLKHCLHQALENLRGQETQVGELIATLSAKGWPALIIVLVIPFCIPIQIPGLSTPFGLAIAFAGVAMALRKPFRAPRRFAHKTIPTDTLRTILTRTIGLLDRFHILFQPRLRALTAPGPVWILHGLTLASLALLLSLPLPIPFSNMAAAVPILILSWGILEDDGIVVLLGYITAAGCFLFFYSLIHLITALFTSLVSCGPS